MTWVRTIHRPESRHRAFLAAALILVCAVVGCSSARVKGKGVSLGDGESVSFQAIGNYAFARGRIELWFRPRWNSDAPGEKILFQTGSRHLKAQIAFRDRRFRLEMESAVLSEAPAISFTTGDPLYIVANYDYPGRDFRIFINGRAGSEDSASHAAPELDWAGVPFRIYAGPGTASSGAEGFTLLRLRTGSRPLSAREITANFARLHSERDLVSDRNTLLDLLFASGTQLRQGYGDITFEKKRSTPTASPPTPLPSLDSVLPQEKRDSWLISDTHWKVQSGALSNASWKSATFRDRDWKNAILKTPEAQRRLGKTYLYSGNPHHAEASAAQWIGVDRGREGSLRRAFMLSRKDIELLRREPGTLYVSAGDRFDCFVNGRWVGTNGGHFRPGYGDVPETTTYWQIPQTFRIANLLHAGANVIAVQLRHDARMSTDEREGLFVDLRKGPFQSARIDWSASPGGTIIRPATLDLREAALRSMEYHLNTDFKSVLAEKGGVFYGWSYGDTLGRALEAIILLRLMTGVDRFPDAERQLMQATLQTFTQDGWSYRELAPHVVPELAIPSSMPYACMWDQAEVLFGLVTWYEKTRSPVLRKYIEGLLAALKRSALRTGDTYHIPQEFWDGRQWVATQVWFNPGAVLLDPIAHYYEISRSPTAWEVLQGLYHSQKKHLGHDGRPETYFDEAYRVRTMRISSEGQDSQNFGAGISLGWTGALRAALVLSDAEMVQWIRRALDWSIGTAATRYGHAQEGLGYLPGEVCGAADLVEAASMLAERVDSRYWSFVERFIRNHIIETQNRESGMWGRVTPEGAMSSPLPCCSSRGARAIYIAWHHTITSKPEGVYVNLALNRDSRWLEVLSWLPYEGRIDLEIHDAPVVFVRIPEWVPHNAVTIESAGRILRAAKWHVEYVRLQGLIPGQHVSVRFPIGNTKTVETLQLQPGSPPVRYEALWRGYTLIRLAPGGQYRRSEMLANTARRRPVTRYFVPSVEVDW